MNTPLLELVELWVEDFLIQGILRNNLVVIHRGKSKYQVGAEKRVQISAFLHHGFDRSASSLSPGPLPIKGM